MRRLITTFFFVFLVFSVSAQSKNPLVFGDALVKNKMMQRTGRVLTVIGGMTLFAGNVMYWELYNDKDNNEPTGDKVDRSVHIMLGGIGLMAAGIPLFTIGKMKERKMRIEAKLENFKGTVTMKSIEIKIKF